MATVASPKAARAIPATIRRGLRRIDRRLRVLGAMEGVGRLAVVLAVGAAAGMAADFLWPMPGVIRWALWMAWVGAGLATLMVAVLRPTTRRLGWADLAAVAEAGNPELGERLVSTVGLLGRRAEPQGSPELIAALVEETEARAGGLDLGRALTGTRARRWLGAGGIAMGVVVLPAVIWPDPFGSMAARFLAPWADVERADRFVVTVRPGDAKAAIGSDFPFRAEVRPRFGGGSASESARLEWTDAEGRTRRASMVAEPGSSGASRAFSFTMKGVAGSFRYLVVSGSAASRSHRIEAVEPPAVASLSARVEPPAYTKFPVVEAKDPSRLNAWEGSKVTLRVTPSRPVARVEVRWPRPGAEASGSAGVVPLKPTGDGRTWAGDVEAVMSGTYAFTLEDEDGLRNRPEMPRRLRVVADAAPELALRGTEAPLESKADDVLVVEVAARDDVAVATAVLGYAITRAAGAADGPEEGRVKAPLDGLGMRAAAGQASLVLEKLGLRPGDEVAYYVEVADNRPAPRGPNVTRSQVRLLRIVDRAEPLMARQASAERESLREKLEALRRAAAANHEAAVQLRYAADAALRGNGPWKDEHARALAEREAEAARIVSGLEDLARDFLESGRFAPLARPTRQVAEVEAEGARAMLESTRREAEPARRLTGLRQADGRLSAVKERIDELIRKFDELARQDDDLRRLGLLAARQEELAARAEELARDGASPAELERIRNEQEALRREVDELTRRSPELKAELLARHAREAEDLAERAHDLAEREREEARRTADPAGRAEALRELLRQQQAIEDEARRLAMQVDTPLQENGRGRLNAEALARPVDPLSRGDVEQARQRLDEAENELRRLARDLEDVRDDPKALARRLARRQEELNNQVNQAIQEANTPEGKAALPERLRPLAERQEAIARLAKAIPAPAPQREQADAATRSTAQAAEDLKASRVDQVPQRQNEARDSLNRLADALADPNQRRQQAQQRLNEARGKMDEVARELERHLRETAPRPDQNADPVAAARDLAGRVAPLVQRQDEVAATLADLDPGADSETRRDRAAARASALADAIDATRLAAPDESAAGRPAGPVLDWHILGHFPRDQAPIVPVGGPVDLKAVHMDRHRRAATWRGVRGDERGVIDLQAAYPHAGGNASAFGYAEIRSPGAGPGRLTVGSDDALTVWLNGRKVYDFPGDRAFGHEQDRVEVEFSEGVNRLLVRCGNGAGEWKFAVAATAPPTGEVARQLARADRLRRMLPLAQADARAAFDRLQEGLWGREPADEQAEDLAAELAELRSKLAEQKPQAPDPGQAKEAAEELRRIASALRGLNVPDAAAPQAEAVRLAERAAKALEKPEGDAPGEMPEGAPAPPAGADAERAVAEAERAAKALARRLADAQSATERAEALARSQRGLDEPEAPRDPATLARSQRALADDLARIPPPGAPDPARDRADDAMAEAVAQSDLATQRPDDPEAARARARAAEALDALARRAEPKDDGQGAQAQANANANPKPSPDPRAQAAALAERQRALAREARAAQEAVNQAPEARRAEAREQLPRQLAPLAERQGQLAEDVRRLPDPAPPGGEARRQAEAQRTEAARAQAQAAESLNRGDPTRAAEEADRAAAALDRLAQSLPQKPERPEPPADPELGIEPEHAEAARELARRERQVRQRLQSALAERVEPQERLREEAAELGRDMAELRDQSRELSGRAQGPAHLASELMQNHAVPAMAQGADQLAQGRPDAARDAQRQAADHAEHAAQAADDAASALRAEIPPDAMAQADDAQDGWDDAQAQGQGQGQAPADGDGLATAREAQRRAGEQLSRARDSGPSQAADSAEAASGSMRQAAQGLRAAARRGQPTPQLAQGQPGGDPRDSSALDPRGGQGTPVAPHLDPLQSSTPAGPGPKGRNWGELPGHLRTEILQMSPDGYRSDYSRLIQLYFREIAAGAPASDKPEPKP